MSNFVISVETGAVEQSLKKTYLKMPTIKKKALRSIGQGFSKEIKKNIRKTTKRRTGLLAKSYKYKVSRDTSFVTVFPSKQKKKKNPVFAKVVVLSYGITYKRKNKIIKIKARNFLNTAYLSYISSNKYLDDIQKMVDKELKKYWSM